MSWQDFLKDALLPRPVMTARPKLPPGLYHFPQERDGQYVRFHLRVDPSGHAILIAGAAEAVQLAPEGAWIAAQLLKGKSAEQVAPELKSRGAKDAVIRIGGLLEELAEPRGRYPIFNLPDPAVEDDVVLAAPFQADVVPGEPATLRKILDTLWAVGIPHVRLKPDDACPDETLAQAVERAEDLGMITGLRATAGRLDERLLARVAKVGLDYVVVPWAASPAIHAALFGNGDYEQIERMIEAIRHWEMTPVLQTPLVNETFATFEEGLAELAQWDIAHVEVFALACPDGAERRPAGENRVDAALDPARATEPAESATGAKHGGDAEPFESSVGESDPTDEIQSPRPLAARQLRQMAAWIEDLSNEQPRQLIWLPPMECQANRIASLARLGPRAGGDVAIRIESDGRVLPPRGVREPAGNLLHDSWESIWTHAAFRRWRGLVERPSHCDQCPSLAICAADCPADPNGWARGDEPDSNE